MSDQRYQITLLFNANKSYDRQVMQGVGEYLQASQCHWDIFIGEDFRCQLTEVAAGSCDGIIADFDDINIQQHLPDLEIPFIAVGGSYHDPAHYPPVHYVATDNHALIAAALNHLKEKGLSRFAFYGLPLESPFAWAAERLAAFERLMQEGQYEYSVLHGMDTLPEQWELSQQHLAQWLQSLPAQTGIIAITDARARHILQVCDLLQIPIPEKLSVIGIDNEELTRYLCRVALSSVVQGAREMGYQAAKLLDKLLRQQNLPLQRIVIPPIKVIGRRSTDYRSLQDPLVMDAMHFIRNHACKGIKVEQVLDYIRLSRSNLEKRFKDETGQTIHEVIYLEKLQHAQTLLTTTELPISEIAQICGYPSLQYFYSVFKKYHGVTPKEYRDGGVRHNTTD
ncbi:MAG: XylR family transcriptional regulator [Enterobacteriaceae bacterium]